MHDRAVFLIPNPWVKADIKTGTPDTSHARADFRGCCVVKPCLLSTIFSAIVLDHQSSGGEWWLHCSSRGHCCHAGQGQGLQETRQRLQLSKSGGLCSVPKTASYQPAASLALIPLMLTMDKPVVPLTCLLAPKIQHLNKFKSSVTRGVERDPGRVSRLEAGTVAIFLFAQNYSRAGSIVDICVTT